MDKKRVVIVGCGLAGAAASEAARSTSQEATITIIDSSDQPPYSKCGLPYVISGKVSNEDLVVKDKDFFTNVLGARYVRGRKVALLDAKNSRIIYDKPDGLEGEDYDSLILATGSAPVPCSVPGADKPGIHRLNTLNDAENVRQSIKGAKSALIIGGSPLALELCEVLSSAKLDITLVARDDEILSGYLDPRSATIVRAILQDDGVNFLLGKEVERFVGFEKAQGVIVGGEVVTADVIILTGHLAPNSSLAREAGLKLGMHGGVLVDAECRTNASNIFAAGDCSEITSSVFRGPVPALLASIAIRMGVTAGANAAGGSERLDNVVRNSSFRIGGIDVCTIGPTAAEAKGMGLSFVEVESSEYQFAFYYPGGRNLYTKLLVAASGALIGAQFVGPSASVWGNLASMMVANSLPVSYLCDLETSFSTLTQPYWPSPLVAARKARDLIFSEQRI